MMGLVKRTPRLELAPMGPSNTKVGSMEHIRNKRDGDESLLGIPYRPLFISRVEMA